MTILITGANGFIGKHVCSLIDNKVCVVRKGQGHKYKKTFEVESINNETDWSGAFQRVVSVIHLAGLAHSKSYSPAEYRSVNVEGALNLARSAFKNGVKRFVFVSSIGVNGETTSDIPFSSISQPNPQNEFARSKYDAEKGLMQFARETELELVIVRPTLVYGPKAPGNFGTLCGLIKKTPVLPFGLAKNKRSFISVLNLADLLVTCATHPNAPGQKFLASDGQAVSIKQFTDAIANGLGKKVFHLPIPVSLFKGVGKITGRQKMIHQLFGNLEVDSSNIQEVLGWSAPYSMHDTMASLIGDKQCYVF